MAAAYKFHVQGYDASYVRFCSPFGNSNWSPHFRSRTGLRQNACQERPGAEGISSKALAMLRYCIHKV